MMMAADGSGRKGSWIRIVILLAVVFSVAGVLAIKDRAGSPAGDPAAAPDTGPDPIAAPAAATESLPRLIDLGADKCIPCKMMAPILEKLKTDLAGQCEIVFIDVWKNPQESPKYGIKAIPTQIFFGPDGQEFFRHQGFFSREDILAAFTEHGITFTFGEI